MSSNPLPPGNPRKNSPNPTSRQGGINWGERMGAGCWAKRIQTPSERPQIDRNRSTIQG